MRKQDFNFHLPEALIAQFPLAERDASRLLHLSRADKTLQHRQFSDLVNLLEAGDCLILNNTRVVPARLPAHKETGGRVEILLERVLSDSSFLCQCRVSKALKPGQKLILANGQVLEVIERHGEFWQLSGEQNVLATFSELGDVPLPPYIKRATDNDDTERYQTVYAQESGAVAAPTAGLHFTPENFEQLAQKGVLVDFVTLHVAAGTFQPIRVDDITQHQMHAEYCELTPELSEKINRAKANGQRIVAVGTTSVRVLESASATGTCQPFQGDTDIFIYPGFEFQCVDAMITNFHLPESSLIMLVAAFAGQDFVLDAYNEAVANEYRFYSYGDAMFIE